MATSRYLIAQAVARNNSRTQQNTWAVVETSMDWYEAIEITEGYPSGTICAYRKGKKIH